MDLDFVYLLLAFGALLLFAETLITTGGVALILAIACFLGAIGIAFAYGGKLQGMTVLLGVVFGMPALSLVFFYLWPNSLVGPPLVPAPEEDVTMANLPVIADLEQYKGQIGKTVSALRPAGIVEFEGRRVDSMSQGTLIEANRWIRCIDVRAGKVIVREIETPQSIDSNFEELT
jgi:membrane-bound ClpP family serine protease